MKTAVLMLLLISSLLCIIGVSTATPVRTWQEGQISSIGNMIINFHQMPVPATTQIGRAQPGSTSTAQEWISFTPGSVYLVDHNESYHEWHPPGFSGYTSTGGGQTEFSYVQFTMEAGDQNNPRHSGIHIGYTAYQFSQDYELTQQYFDIRDAASPEMRLKLYACPNYEVGQTGGDTCPGRTLTQGEWKFSVLGLIAGANINSLNNATPPLGSVPTDSSYDRVIYDIAGYKKIIYRTMLDVGAMGANAKVKLVSGGRNTGVGSCVTCVANTSHEAPDATTNGTDIADVSPSFNIAEHALRIFGDAGTVLQISFAKNYMTGTWDLARANCTQQYRDDLDRLSKTCDEDSTNPVLNITEVKAVNVTIRPASWDGRPTEASCPMIHGNPDHTNCWSNATIDAPWWYRAAWTPPGTSDTKWAGVEMFGGRELNKLDHTACESGYCYHIDFEFDLGGETEDTRTGLGNPVNDKEHGTEKGTFFLYDPTVNDPTVNDPTESGGSGGGSGGSSGSSSEDDDLISAARRTSLAASSAFALAILSR